MATVRFEIRSPRPNWTGEGAGNLYFRDGVAELSVDLDNWEPGNARGALSYYKIQGFDIIPLDGVSVDEALRDPGAEARAVQAELDSLDLQIRAETSRDDLRAKRQQLDDLRAKRAAADKAALEGDAQSDSGASEGGVKGAPIVRTDVPPPALDAPVADWRAYAVEIDPSLDDAAAKRLDKTTLVSTYGNAFQGGVA